MGIHINGYLDTVEPFPHEMFSCGIYFGFMFYTLIGCIAICFGMTISMLLELIVNISGALLFLIASIVTMMHVENDYHLMYLTDREELTHPFFVKSRQQSFISLFTGFIFALHATIICDMLCITKRIDTDEYIDEARQPIQLYFFPYHLFNWIKMKMAKYTTWADTESERIDFSFEIRTDRNIDRVL